MGSSVDQETYQQQLRARSLAGYYTEPAGEPPAPRTCAGLACHLARRRSGAGPEPGHREVHCLGWCDQGPTTLSAANAIATSAGPGGTPPAIRLVGDTAIVTARLAAGDHSALDRARRAGVYGALARALKAPPTAVLDALEASGEQGRGGAGFPTGRKWRLAAATPASRRFVVANGDEGDPGSFIDRLLLEQDPHAVIEGLALCAYAIGASEGLVFIRAEYPRARVVMEAALGEARAAGLLGPAVLGTGFRLEIRVVAGQGSYVCGEETALLNAIEGRRGEVRVRPPFPAEAGLWGCPTVVNNIETLVNVPWIVARGPAAFRALGTTGSPGTKAFCLSAGFRHPGVVEAPYGIPLATLIRELGGGGTDGELAGVSLGGPMGSILLPHEWDVAVDYPSLAARGIRLGHGGLVALPAGTHWAELLVHWASFMARESCGKCAPCRLGSARAERLARQLLAAGGVAGHGTDAGHQLRELLDVVASTSLCGFGQGIPGPLETLRALVAGER